MQHMWCKICIKSYFERPCCINAWKKISKLNTVWERNWYIMSPMKNPKRWFFGLRDYSVENIQKTTAEYYNIKMSDILSKWRSRSVSRPRQMAKFLAKELTNYSLPEIGESFGGREHTTVIHACKKINELRSINPDIEEDYRKLLRVLTI